MNDKQFKEAVYELAFGCSAIDKDYSEDEVLAKIREFSDDALRADGEVYVVLENGDILESFLSPELAEEYAVNIADDYDTDITIKTATWRLDDD